MSVGMDVGRLGGISQSPGAGTTTAQQLQPRLNVRVGRIKLGCPLVGVQRIVDLVVARLILRNVLGKSP